MRNIFFGKLSRSGLRVIGGAAVVALAISLGQGSVSANALTEGDPQDGGVTTGVESIEEAPVEGEGAAEGEDSVDTPEPVDEATPSPPEPELPSARSFSEPVQEARILGSASWQERTNKRVSGINRYSTAVAVSNDTFEAAVSTVIVASGDDFPDALSAAALSARLRAPLLLVERGSVPVDVRAELARLKPQKIVIVGGPGVIAPQVEDALKSLLKNPAGSGVDRVYGLDRYSTSAEVSRYGWSGGSAAAFIATGSEYADALAAGAAAGKLGVPVLLVPGTDKTLPAASSNELTRLKATKLHVAGGEGSISPAILAQLVKTSGKARDSVRYAGKDRYETAAKIVDGVFEGGYVDTYWANAYAFADALAGAAAAGARGAALLLVEPGCVPSVTYAANDRVAPGSTTLLGGTGVITDQVLHGNECRTRPSSISPNDWSASQSIYTTINKSRFDKGLAGLRVADSAQGVPAQTWATQVVQGTARDQPDLAKNQPWVRFQASAVTNVASNPAQRLFTLIQGNPGAARWLYQPNSGARGFVSIGVAVKGQKTSASVFIGSAVG